jgi:methionyl-tRNA formyltransferase
VTDTIDPTPGLAPVPVHPRRLVYLGSPAVAVPPLVALVDAGFDVELVVTGADKRRGRGGELTPTPVKAAALERGLAVSHAITDTLGVGADLGVVVAYGRLIRRPVLEALPMVNLHFSRLPRWRGAAPVERALLAGDTETAVDLMGIEEGLDTGPVYAEAAVPIDPADTLESLRTRLANVGAALLVDTLSTGLPAPTPQRGEPTYAAKITSEDLRIDWAGDPVVEARKTRLGGAWTTLRNKRVKILAAEVRDGHLQPTVVQPEGKAPQPFDQWRHGARLAPGEWFS